MDICFLDLYKIQLSEGLRACPEFKWQKNKIAQRPDQKLHTARLHFTDQMITELGSSKA